MILDPTVGMVEQKVDGVDTISTPTTSPNAAQAATKKKGVPYFPDDSHLSTLKQAALACADRTCMYHGRAERKATIAHMDLAGAFEAGAAWMWERVLQAAPCDYLYVGSGARCRVARADHAATGGHIYRDAWWLTDLCASDVEKEEPRHER